MSRFADGHREVMSPRQKVVVGVFGGLMLALLTTQLLVLEESRRSINHQEQLAAAASERNEPVVEEALALLRAAEDVGGPLDRSRALLHRALREAPAISRATERIPQIARATEPLPALADALLNGGRVTAVLDGVAALLAHLSETNLVLGASESFENLRNLLEEQRDLLAVQIEALRILRDSLSIQRRTFKRVRSIDRRLGGVLPAPAP